MRLDHGLRLSTYLTVALAGASLTYAEEPFFPGFTLVAAALAILLVTAYFVEGSWWLSAQSANALGIVISLSWIIWVTFFSSEFEDPLGRPPWPAVFLPYLGPLLMVLVLVKLFRPKGIRDYWYLHLIGLIEVAVGCVLVVEAEFGLWLLAYIICASWSMTIFYLHRASLGTIATSPERIPWRHFGVWAAAWRAGVVAFVALVMFLITPQHGTTEVISEMRSRTSLGQTGFSNTIMDLNTTGRLEVDESVAFEVYVENADGSPKTKLPYLRWRGLVLDHYSQGRWVIQPGSQLNFTLHNDQYELPHLGPDEFFITYHINTAQSHGLFLAEPVVVQLKTKPEKDAMPKWTLPYVSETFGGIATKDQGLFNYRQQEDFVAGVVPLQPIRVTYRQVAQSPPPDGLSRRSPLSPNERAASPMERLLTRQLLDQPVPGIRDFTEDLLEKMVDEKKLTENDLKRATPPKGADPKSQSLIRVKREKVARALSDYLALSGKYSYSFNLTRQELKLDPTEDFLKYVKEGHCERFATALVLMLRSAGIPSRLVVGFRGYDIKNPSNKEDGWYVIRQSHAHAWVEALVGVETPDRNMELRWLTLDPSPQAESPDRPSFSWSSWKENFLLQLRTFWRVYILEYNANQQSEAVNSIWTRSGLDAALDALASWVQREPYWLAGLTVILVGLVWLRPILGRRRGSRRIDSGTDFYHRLLGLLARSCRLAPKVGQTPKEFGQTAQVFLTQQDLGTDLADLPVRIIQLFYQVRYGRLPLNPAQCEEIDRQLDHLGAALKKIPRLAN